MHTKTTQDCAFNNLFSIGSSINNRKREHHPTTHTLENQNIQTISEDHTKDERQSSNKITSTKL